MRLFAVITWLALWPVAAAYGQSASRFELGPVARLDVVLLEGGASGGAGVAGVVASYRLWNTYGVEAEIRGASNEVERSYEGWFGWTTAFVARGEISARAHRGACGHLGTSLHGGVDLRDPEHPRRR